MIEVKNLTKQYGQKRAVDNISFTVNDGEILGFLGPNGAGKSTTMNILTGYISSTEGQALINGIDILEEPTKAKKEIGYLPELPPLYLDMTVREYLNFIYDLKKCKLPRKAHLADVCSLVKINDVYNRIIRNLSKGYKQRVGIAQALVGNPEIIIFDEPTVGLDPKQIIEIRNLIRTLGRDHTVILSTHILQEVQACCDRILIINKGRIVADEETENISRAVENNRRFNVKICGPQREVLAMLKSKPGIVYAEALPNRDGEAYVYMIESEVGVDIRKSLFYTLAEKNWPMIGLEALGMSLEDIFITIVDKSNEIKTRREVRARKTAPAANALEKDIAQSIMQKTAQQKNSEFAKKD